jgi:hypothetical protein
MLSNELGQARVLGVLGVVLILQAKLPGYSRGLRPIG